MNQEAELRETWSNKAPFSPDQMEKDAFFQYELSRLTDHHRRACPAYDAICRGLGYGALREEDTDPKREQNADPKREQKVDPQGEQDADLREEVNLLFPGMETGPRIPVALFKSLELRSVPTDEVVRQVTSSGTTGQQVSRIFLDAQTAQLQRWALASITGDFIGSHRMPMLIIDSPDVLKDRRKFSARGAGILGFSMMSSKRYYALDEQMQPDWDSILAFQEAAQDGPAFAFGFTFMIWEYFFEALKKAGRSLDLKDCCLIHGGGWKKLQDRAVSDALFREELRRQCGFGQICDYYGMAEQTGSIFMQCPEGHLHASIFSDIEVLDPLDFSPCEAGKWGLLALRSWIPGSYPGHFLLTEDWGRILGTDDCPCGRKGRYFQIRGRISKAEIRGCSDTFAASRENEDEEVKILAGSWPVRRETMAAFDPLVMEFLSELSRLFMKDPDYRQYPDIYALGFWLREGHLKQIQARQAKQIKNESQNDAESEVRSSSDPAHCSRRGRGTVLHIAPSNMPAMFAYSWITALLAGNGSIVRLSGKESLITDTILRGISTILDKPEYERLRAGNAFIRFPRGHRLLEEISQNVSARMIWGGDATVARITSVPKSPQAVDIPFPDKYSIAVMDAQAIEQMSEEELRLQANLFCRDTYGADQNACSSPRSVFWIEPQGETDTAGIRRRWWDLVADEAKRYELQPWMATEKYRLLCEAYAGDSRLEPAQAWTNRLYVVPCGRAADWTACSSMADRPADSSAAANAEPDSATGKNVSPDSVNDAPPARLPEGKLGMFFEFDLEREEEMYPLLTEKIQTAVCIGTDPERFLRSVRAAGCPGVDRAVCAGQALEFDTVWDRKDLIRILSEEKAAPGESAL